MIVGIRDAAKLAGIFIIACCAVLVCTMFLNYQADIAGIRDAVAPGPALAFYEAQLSTAKVVSTVSGGCLLVTSVIMLLFYIRHYIDTHRKELGILKALGFSSSSIARHFWVFGISVFLGAAAGFGGAFLLMPMFYRIQNQDHILPDIAIRFHPQLLLCMVFLPSLLFALLSMAYAYRKLRQPSLELLREQVRGVRRPRKRILAFFVIFAAFCFSSMTQMAASMRDLSSAMMAAMMLLIGLTLACTTLLLAITTVIRGNTKTIAIMRVFGYSQRECCQSLLGRYRPMAYLGFAVGTAYQYALLKIMVVVVFKDIADMPEYAFDFPAMAVSLAVFALAYEIIMYYFSEKIKGISVKEIMIE